MRRCQRLPELNALRWPGATAEYTIKLRTRQESANLRLYPARRVPRRPLWAPTPEDRGQEDGDSWPSVPTTNFHRQFEPTLSSSVATSVDSPYQPPSTVSS